jgi:hypothetical protein
MSHALKALFFISILLSSVSITSFVFAQNETSVSSPSNQFEKGVLPAEINCEQGFLIILKKSDYSPACVRADSVEKLVERSWGLFNVTISWFRYDPINCKQDPYQENSTSLPNDHFLSIEQEFKDKKIILLDLWQYFPVREGGAADYKQPCGYSGNMDYFGVPVSNMSAMDKMGFKQINSTQVCAGTHCYSVHEGRFFCPLGYAEYYEGYKCVSAPSQILMPTPFDMG